MQSNGKHHRCSDLKGLLNSLLFALSLGNKVYLFRSNFGVYLRVLEASASFTLQGVPQSWVSLYLGTDYCGNCLVTQLIVPTSTGIRRSEAASPRQ